jgi:CheY-like chemotaxis protein
MKHLAAVDILLVEDNPLDAELVIRALKKRHLADRVFVAEDGAEALDFVFGRGQYTPRQTLPPPKVILLDVKLPKLNGLEVLRAIKAHPQSRAIPVVMVTSSREAPDLQTAYALGVNSYVVKPVAFDEFQEAVIRLSLYWLRTNQALA